MQRLSVCSSRGLRVRSSSAPITQPTSCSSSSAARPCRSAARKAYIPFAKSVETYAYRFEVDHTDSRAAHFASMRKLALERQIRWIKETRGKREPTRYTREFKLCPAPTSYILTDTRQIATLRARLRLNRHHLRSRQRHVGQTVDDRCQHCLALNNQPAHLVPSETPQHVLFDCPLHDQPRWLWSFRARSAQASRSTWTS